MTLPDWANGADDERVVWEGRPRERLVHWGLLVGVLAGIALAAGTALVLGGSVATPFDLVVLLTVGLLGVLVPAGGVWLWRAHTHYVLTDAALYHRTGVLWIRVTEVPLDAIQNSSFEQGVFGTLFGHGTVGVSTAGSDGDAVRLVSLPAPREAHRAITDRVSGAGNEGTVPGSLSDWQAVLEEVRAVGDLVGER